jgi:hypothetical protein
MSPTTIADPALIPDIEAFEERVAIHIFDGGIPTDQAKDLAHRRKAAAIRRTTGLGSGCMLRGRAWGRSTHEELAQPLMGLGMIFIFDQLAWSF